MIVVLVFLSAGIRYTQIIYRYGIYLAVFLGILLLAYYLYNKKIKLKKIDVFLGLFVICYFITMICNYESGVFRQGLVLLCCLMYFFIVLSTDAFSAEKIKQENELILKIIVTFTFVASSLSIGAVILDGLNGEITSFNLHRGDSFQLIGIYSGIATCALMSGLSAVISFYLLIKEPLSWKQNRGFIIFNVVNFLLQDFVCTIAYTSAGIVTFGCAILIGATYWSIKRVKTKRMIVNIFLVLIVFSSLIINYCAMDFLGQRFVAGLDQKFNFLEQELPADDPDGGMQTIKADNAKQDVFSSNGRLGIWESGIEQWKEKPVFGIGYGNFYYSFKVENDEGDEILVEYENIHNGYLEVLVACGIICFILIMSFGVYYIYRLLIYFLRKDGYSDEIIVAMLIVYVCLYAMINQLFILDRCLNTFLLCLLLGQARKMIYVEEDLGNE